MKFSADFLSISEAIIQIWGKIKWFCLHIFSFHCTCSCPTSRCFFPLFHDNIAVKFITGMIPYAFTRRKIEIVQVTTGILTEMKEVTIQYKVNFDWHDSEVIEKKPYLIRFQRIWRYLGFKAKLSEMYIFKWHTYTTRNFIIEQSIYMNIYI